MRIAFYAPHKPIDHHTPSGDLYIGKSLFNFLQKNGHDVRLVSKLRTHGILQNPLRWSSLITSYTKCIREVKKFSPDIWLTYHSYYKSPDILGPTCSQKLDIPYIIYQGIYSTKRKREISNWAGYMLNKHALMTADYVFANKSTDYTNLSRIILPEKLSFIRPGISVSDFRFSKKDRDEIRKSYRTEDKTIILTVAMFRNGVKKKSLLDLLESYSKVETKFPEETILFVAGEGECFEDLKIVADQLNIKNIIFLGKIPRQDLYRYYSAADIFAYPGIGEALGMVYLEAQSAGLPAIAYHTRGPEEAISDGVTGILTRENNTKSLSDAIVTLIADKKLREEMSSRAPERVTELFDINNNFKEIERKLFSLIR